MSICDVWWDLDFVSEFILGLGESHIKPDHLAQVVGDGEGTSSRRVSGSRVARHFLWAFFSAV